MKSNSTIQSSGLCQSYNIDYWPVSVAYPQDNGQVEVTNRTLLEGVKIRLEGAKGKWVKELPSVLWAYRTTVRMPIGESPFRLAYGTEPLAPVEVLAMFHRVLYFNERTYDDRLWTNLDFMDEVHEKALLRNVAYQQRTTKYYNARVKERLFHQGDLVLRRARASQPRKEGKLSANWEGPHIISKQMRLGTNHLKTLGGKK
ncbi:uncharacterized protein LOC122643410 [Telopea speciosissima]|uniref:uncharacterized protein LOC122643410 n=1 Tax=Telopea speciosissima TaxID=54955 RepID=UPI001CC747AB|nr:uncharacterized protein LOC122643410 [Telopea speciosissima]